MKLNATFMQLESEMKEKQNPIVFYPKSRDYSSFDEILNRTT